MMVFDLQAKVKLEAKQELETLMRSIESSLSGEVVLRLARDILRHRSSTSIRQML